MSDHDRGAYTPPSDRLAFDPRVPVRSGPAPITLILSAVVLLALVGGVAFLYRNGARHPGAGPAEVGTPVGAMKTPAPADPNAAPAASLAVDKVAVNATPTFAPPPEQPQLRPAQTPALIQPPQPGAPQPVPAGSPPPAPPAAQVAAAKPLAAPPTATPAKPLTIASLADAAIAKPAATPRSAALPAAPAPVAGGAAVVQIGAYSSAALGAAGWSGVAKLEPAAMAGKGRDIQPVRVGGKTLYRTSITGFASRGSAQAFCDRLKAAGKTCFVK